MTMIPRSIVRGARSPMNPSGVSPMRYIKNMLKTNSRMPIKKSLIFLLFNLSFMLIILVFSRFF